MALPAPSSPMLALPGVPGATPGGKALALRREGPGASSEELRGALMPLFAQGICCSQLGCTCSAEARGFRGVLRQKLC